MVDAIDFNTLNLTAEFAQEEELTQLESQHSGQDTEQSTELELFSNSNYELDFFSQHSQTSSGQSSQSQPNQCTNCKAQNTLQVDDATGHKICNNCSHIVQDYQDMQLDEQFGDEDDIEIADMSKDILKEKQKNVLKPLRNEIIHPQQQFSKLILNAFQCILQAQISVLIHKYKIKPHLYKIIGQLWFRFLNKIWIKQGFGAKNVSNSDWVWNKNQSKLYQNNDFEEKWIAPKRSVIDVLLTTEDDTDITTDDDIINVNDSTSDSDTQSHSNDSNVMNKHKQRIGDSIDLDSLLSDGSQYRNIASQTSITKSKTKKKTRRKIVLTEKELKKHQKRMELKRRQILPRKCMRFTDRIIKHDVFGWKKVNEYEYKKNQRSDYDRYLYGKGEINLELSLVLLYIGCRICGEILTMNDIICGAQKCIIPYLRAFESLPQQFRIKNSKQRRDFYVTDANYVSFKKFFQRNEMKYDMKRFYYISNLLIRDMGLSDKIVPFNSKLMVIKYLRDLNIPLALYSIIEIFMDKYKAFPDIFCKENKQINKKWKELNEYG
eukprot:42031_1